MVALGVLYRSLTWVRGARLQGKQPLLVQALGQVQHQGRGEDFSRCEEGVAEAEADKQPGLLQNCEQKKK